MTNAQLRKAIVTRKTLHYTLTKSFVFTTVLSRHPPPHAIVKLLPFLLYLTGEVVFYHFSVLKSQYFYHNDIKTVQTGIKYFLMFQIKYLWSNKKSYEYNIVNIMDYTSKILLVCVRGRVVCKTELQT